MGSWSGHTLPGSLFICFGLVYAIKTAYRYFFSGTLSNAQNRRCTRFKTEYIEAVSKIFFSGFGLVIEQLLPWEPWFHLTEKTTHEFNRANNWSHSTMYAFFVVSGVVDLMVMKMPKVMPHCIHHICMGLAFWVEGYLFYFHTHGREELDVRIHVLLIFAIWPASLLYILLAAIDNNANFVNAYILGPQLRHKTRNNQRRERDTTSLLHQENEDVSDENIQLQEKTSSSDQWFNNNNQNFNDRKDLEKLLSNRKKIFTLQLCLATITILQGTWFWQTAYVLYPPNGEPWAQESHKNMAFLTMFFTWHLLLAMSVVTGIFIIFGLLHKKTRSSTTQSRNYSSLQTDALP